MTDKVMTFKHTQDGMLTVANQRGEFLLKNEMLGVLHEMIGERERVLSNYSSEDDTRKDEEWFKLAKTKYESQLEVLKEVKKLLY